MTPSRGDKIALVGHLQTKSRSPMRMSRLCAVLAVTVGAPLVYAEFAIGAALAENCCSPAGKDWPYTTGNLGGWGYTSLTQINRKNIEQLGPVWVTHVSAEPVTTPVPGPGNNATAQQTIPVVVDGVMYLDTPSGGVIALDGATGAVKWKWQPSVAANGFGGNSQHRGVRVGEAWTTKVTPNDTPNNCYLPGGATAWQHPTIDPELWLLYQAFGNVRGCNGSQNGENRPGDNLFGSSVVALDLKTGAYKWHFQAVRHDIWDMDNALPPALADVMIGGQLKKVLFYGSKSGFQFTLDRSNGKPALPIEYRAVPADIRNAPALTQPFPLQEPFMPQCVALQNLGSDVPGLQNRMVPNWNGYQAEPDPANPGQLKLVLRTPNYLTPTEPFLVGPPRLGCMYDGSYDGFVQMSMTGQNGGNDMTNTSISPRLNLRYVGLSYSPVGHPLQQGGNGLRQIGGYQTGAILAVDNSTGKVVWYKALKFDLSRQHNPLVTATDLLFHTQMDGWLVGRDAATGDELWRFQMGAPSQAGTISYEINDEQYIATTNMAGSQPYAQGGNGDAVWAFKLGGTAKYHTGPRSNPVYVSGSQEAPAPLPIANWRRPVDNTAPGIVPPNEIWMARSNGNANSTPDSTNTSSMVPSQRTVPVGTTVTFRNPGVETFPNSPNLKEHCATQFFEGLFNFRLQPGETAQYTFNREGEYFYNDCTDPRPVGKVIVTAIPESVPGALEIDTLDFRAERFTDVKGPIIAMFRVPAGYTFDGDVKLTAPLTTQTFPAEEAEMIANGKKLKITFDKGLIDNNVPAGDAVPLTVSANFMHDGVQKKLTSTTNVRVLK